MDKGRPYRKWLKRGRIEGRQTKTTREPIPYYVTVLFTNPPPPKCHHHLNHTGIRMQLKHLVSVTVQKAERARTTPPN